MGVKVRYLRGSWWVVAHHDGKRWKKRVGSEKEAAKEAAKELQRRLATGELDGKPEAEREDALPFDAHLRDWHLRHSVTFKPRYQESSQIVIENHLVPFFGPKDVREIREADLLDFIRV